MYPEFVMDGVEYKAERNYTVIARIPTAVIRCTRKDAPEKEKKYRHGRKKWMRILRICWPAVTGTLLLIFYGEMYCFQIQREELLYLLS